MNRRIFTTILAAAALALAACGDAGGSSGNGSSPNGSDGNSQACDDAAWELCQQASKCADDDGEYHVATEHMLVTLDSSTTRQSCTNTLGICDDASQSELEECEAAIADLTCSGSNSVSYPDECSDL